MFTIFHKLSLPVIITALVLGSCKKELSTKGDDQASQITGAASAMYTRPGQATILGKRIPNYYKPSVINEAIKRLKARSSAVATGRLATVTVGGINVAPNFRYVRFLPADEDQLMKLQDEGYDLYEEPLDFETEQEGEYYQDPSIPDGAMTWMYTVLPIDQLLPEGIKAEILSEEFLFNTELEELEEDEFEDGYPEAGSAYDCATDSSVDHRTVPCVYSRRSKLMNDAYNWLVSMGIDPEALDDEAEDVAGYVSTERRCAKRYPQGKITVADPDLNTNVPVKGVMIKARNFLKLKRVYTDASGNFKVTKKYRKTTILVKFKNRLAVTRGIDNWLKVWDIFYPIKYKIGKFTCDGISNIQYNFSYNSDNKSQQAERFAACHFMNSLWETYDNVKVDHIRQPPNKLRVYLVGRWLNGDAFTPMFSQTYGRGFPLQEFINILEFKLARGIGGLLKKLLLKNAPDIFIPTFTGTGDKKKTKSASQITEFSYHELSHAIHYAQVSGVYWKRYTYPAYGYNLLTYAGDYGPKNGQYASFIALIEMWGYYYGHTQTNRKYKAIGNVGIAPSISLRYRNELENNIPDDNMSIESISDGSRGWIPFGMLHDMTDTGEPFTTGVTDIADAYNVNQLFRGMGFNVITPCGYVQTVLAANGQLQAPFVQQLLGDYRWGCN